MVLEMAIQKSKDQKLNSLIKERIGSKKQVSTKPSIEEESLSFGGTTVNKSTKAVSSTPDSDDEYDDLFKDL
jgi:hypothetical protein